MKKLFQKPTDGELEILQILWEHGPVSVRFVNEQLNQKHGDEKEIGYTTTLKLMQIMLDKGLVERNTDSRTHIYAAGVNEGETQQRLLNQFVDAAFRGSAMKLVMQALGNHEASNEELEEIKALIKQMDNRES